MQKTNRYSITIIVTIAAIALCIRLYAFFPVLVESTYTSGIYPVFSNILRLAFGWLPFSIGDLLYASAVLFILWKIFRRLKHFRNERRLPGLFKEKSIKVIYIVLSLYIVFNLMWGLNYNRTGIHGQMNFEREKYSKDDLIQINLLLLEKVNEYKAVITKQNTDYPPAKRIFQLAQEAFSKASDNYPFLRYTHISVKPSLFNFIGNYFGISGYYNPFTGEAQVNTDVPLFLQPYIACHEMSHQLGYAKENEANFAGFIVATASDNPMFAYSAYFDLFMYANRNLYRTDSSAAKQISTRLLPAVKDDITLMKAYYRKYENPVEPVFRWVYGKYLEANDQPLGMITYSEVVADLISWHKKYGKLSG